MKIILRILADAAVIFLSLALITGWRALSPPRMPRHTDPEDLGMPHREISFMTSDGVRLRGWLIPSKESRGVIICLHGYPANKSDILHAVSFLHPGFDLLLFDFRAHGESGGRITHFGLREHLDVRAALDFAARDTRTRGKKAGIWGYSMGGAAGIRASSLYGDIKAIVTDSSFADFNEMITAYYGNAGPFKKLFSAWARMMGRAVLKSDFTANSPEKTVGGIKAPILIIHSISDDFVPFSHAERLFARAPEPKRLYPAGGLHDVTNREFCSGYRETVISFFSQHLRDRDKPRLPTRN